MPKVLEVTSPWSDVLLTWLDHLKVAMGWGGQLKQKHSQETAEPEAAEAPQHANISCPLLV